MLWAAAAAAVLAGPWLDGVPVDFVGTAVVAALAWEVIVEWQDRAHFGDLQVAWSYPQVYAATAARARLEAAGITTTTRGQTYRLVTQFFGALVPIEILVLPHDTARAQAILAEPPRGAVAPAPQAAPPDPTNPWSG